MSSPSDFHAEQVRRRCRVCARVLAARPVPASVQKYPDELLVVFGVDIRSDHPDHSPAKLCSTCYSSMKRSYSSETKGGQPREVSARVVREWEPCGGEHCQLCMTWRAEKRGGRPVKPTKRGRPPADTGTTERKKKVPLLPQPGCGESSAYDTTVVKTVTTHPTKLAAEKELAPERFTSDLHGYDYLCPICRNVVDEAMAVPLPRGCEHTCCQQCWEEWLAVSETCPVCRDTIHRQDLQIASRHFRAVIAELTLHCDFHDRGCPEVVRLDGLRQHVTT